MAGLTSEGLVIQTLPEVVDTLKTTASNIWQDVTPEGEVVNVDDNSAIGRQIGVVAPSISDLWETVQEVYDAFNPNAAEGIALDNLVALGGISRLPDTPTRVNALVTGNTNVVIDTGNKVSSSTSGRLYSNTQPVGLYTNSCSGIGLNFISVTPSTLYTVSFKESQDVSYTNINVTTPSSGVTELSIIAQFQALISSSFPQFITYLVNDRLFIRTADPFQQFGYISSANIGIVKVVKPVLFIGEESGPVEQPIGTVDTIATPVLGWDSVTNPVDATVGRYEETDSELRERFRNGKFEKATNVIESLYSAILNINGVGDLRIYENDTNVVDSNGVNGHSFLTIVEGGLATEIAQAIWDNKPIGILSQGNTTVTVYDTQGLPHDVSFSRPVPVNIYISVDITSNSDFPPDGETKIKQALVDYIKSLKVGEDVVYSRLYTPINSVVGHHVNSLFIGTSPSPSGTSNITIDFDKVAYTEINIIGVN